MDKYARLLQRLGLRSDEREVKMHRPTSKIGDILDDGAKIPSHCFLTMHQWNKIQSQTYLQLHNDGAGQLITKDEACSQTLVSSYRQSYVLHSQFIVSNDSSYLARQKETLKSVAGALNQIVWMYRERPKSNFLAFSLRVSGKSLANDHLLDTAHMIANRSSIL